MAQRVCGEYKCRIFTLKNYHPDILPTLTKKMGPKQLTVEKRALIVYFHNQGEAHRSIAEKVGCGKSTVNDVLRRLETTGTTSPSKRPGRPKIFDMQAQSSLKRLATTGKNRRLSASQLRDLWEKKKTVVSTKTIRRALKDIGLRSCVARRKPLLTDTQIANRLAWALEHQHWTVNEWRRVLWSDESTFYQFPKNNRCRVWREPEEEFAASCVTATVKHSPSQMFWGCFSYYGLGPLVALEGSVNGEMHAKTLRKHAFPTLRKLFPRGDGIFQEDNAPPHRCKVATAVRETNGVQCLPWPPQSPDLNPIENLWSNIKTTVYSRSRKPKNRQHLVRVVKEAWKAISLQYIQGLVDSMPHRVQACIAAQGGSTKY